MHATLLYLLVKLNFYLTALLQSLHRFPPDSEVAKEKVQMMKKVTAGKMRADPGPPGGGT